MTARSALSRKANSILKKADQPDVSELETDRLLLTPVQAADLKTLQTYLADDGMMKYMNRDSVPRVEMPDGRLVCPPNAAMLYMNKAAAGIVQGTEWVWVVRLKGDSTRKMIGLVHLYDRSGKEGQAAGTTVARRFMMDPAYQKGGLMTEASNEATDQAVGPLGFKYVLLINALENAASENMKKNKPQLQCEEITYRTHKYIIGERLAVIRKVTAEAWKQYRQKTVAQSRPSEIQPRTYASMLELSAAY